MRYIAHGTLFFKDPSIQQRLNELMLCQCSAVRTAYQAIHQKGLKGNAVKIHVKKDYMSDLNQTYISDAVSNAKQVNQDFALFGGKRNWEKLQNGSLSKEEWQSLRNNQIYSSGDRDRKGNRNIRLNLNEGKLLINDSSKHGKWLECDLFIPRKFKNKIQTDCYDVRILRRNDKYEVKIGWDEESSPKIFTRAGAIGIDTNPNGLAVVETDKKGNLLKHFFLKNNRIQFARKEKRKNDVHLLAKEVVDFALDKQKSLILEKLSFKTKEGSKNYRKFNRMRSNFLSKQLIEAIERRAERLGVPVIKVNPGYTSILGLLKYSQMYSLNRHTAAALVIARRGLGIKERQTFSATKFDYVVKEKKLRKKKIKRTLSKYKAKKYGLKKKVLKPKKVRLNSKRIGVTLEGRSHIQILKSVQSWEWMTKYIRHPRKVELTVPQLVPESLESFLSNDNGKSCKHEWKSHEQVPRTGQVRQVCVQT